MFRLALDRFKPYPALLELLRLQLSLAPQEEKFFARRFEDASSHELELMEQVSQLIRRLAAEPLEKMAEDYLWLCERQLEEELYFRRHKRYRLSTFQQAHEEVYSDPEYMRRYMNGLLLSQLWWSNHTGVLAYYRDTFLPRSPESYQHLEVGPGHGLLLYFAASDPRSGHVEAWDISPVSLEQSRNALQRLTIQDQTVLHCRNLFETHLPERAYDNIVCSEFLEHMETPGLALEKLASLLSSNGRLYLNMPINSPAPDHLFNQESPEALFEFIEGKGLRIQDSRLFPATNSTLERARQKKLTINCAIIAAKESLHRNVS